MQKKLLELFNNNKIYLDNESYKEIIHYYKHDEYEMALEGFLIELISYKIYPEYIEKNELINMAKFYGLDKELVFAQFTWEDFLSWLV